MAQKGFTAPVILIIALLFGGFLLHVFTRTSSSGPAATVNPKASTAIFSDISDWSLYKNGNLAFAIKHPKDFVANENYRYTLALPTDPSQNPIPGVAFMVPSRFTSGTNLAQDSKISVEVSPDFCQIDKMQSYGGRTGDVPNATEELGGVTYKEVVRSDAGVGNFYSETLHSTGVPAVNGNCYGVRLFLHSNNIGILKETNPNVREFDQDAIVGIYKDMIRTLLFI